MNKKITASISFGFCPKCGLVIGGGSGTIVTYVNGTAYHPACAPKAKDEPVP